MHPPELTKLLEKYKSCNTYQDKGLISGDLRSDAEFATYFERPNKFRFEWKSYSGKEMIITCLENKAECVLPQKTFRETDFLNGVNLTSGLTRTAVPFVCKLLLPDEEFYYDVLELGPFETSSEGLDDGSYKWIFTNTENSLHSEKLLVNCIESCIIERTVKVDSTEYQAKSNAANFFKDSDPKLSEELSKEAKALKSSGITYTSKYYEVKFDELSDELKSQKFRFLDQR